MNLSRGRASFKDHKAQPLGVGVGGFSTKLPKRRGGSGPHVLQNFFVGVLFVCLVVILSTADLRIRVIVVRRHDYPHGRTSEGSGVRQRGNSARASEIDEPFPGAISDALRLRELEIEEGRGGGEEVEEEEKVQGEVAARVVWVEPRIETVWQGPPLEQFLDQKTEEAMKELEQTLGASQPFQLHIQVGTPSLGAKNPNSNPQSEDLHMLLSQLWRSSSIVCSDMEKDPILTPGGINV